ncbi:MAG: aminotransferase class I/II-fold pyridoxal phosphate-dependent enzyme [Alphaproteobacteria bacterium]|nr:aminotransferase class I/II-fold pyridoxal phosphate-dependent enzyme [Alphaproteobacteria bacterium]
MDAEEMKALGYRMVDMVVAHLANRSDETAAKVGTLADLSARLGGPVPQTGSDPVAAMAVLEESVLAHMQHGDHPRYFARVPGPSSYAGILGDWLATGYNAIASSWAGGSGTAVLELVVLDWIRELLAMPKGTSGILASGGSMANFTAFAACFAVKGRGIVYLNDQTHASLKRNITALGIPREDMRILKTGADLKFDMGVLAETIAADRTLGKSPVLVIANGGTTNTGTADPLHAVADLCAAQNLWMHVDGAYGAPAAFTPKGKAHLAGMERAHSLVLDPHKWLFQPYDCGIVLVREAGALEKAFAMYPEYLKDVMAREGEIDLFNRSLELTRRARALKIWLTFKTHGVEKIIAAIARGIELAEFAEAEISRHRDTWELTTPAQIGVVTFAFRGAGEKTHAAMVDAITATGYATLTSTIIGGRNVLRLCTLNPLTTEADIAETLARLAAIGRGL